MPPRPSRARVFMRLPASLSIEDAMVLCEQMGAREPRLHSTPSVPVVGSVEIYDSGAHLGAAACGIAYDAPLVSVKR